MDAADSKRVLVIIPAFNECYNLPRTIAEIRRVIHYADIVVIDDGSQDATCQIARECGVIVLRLVFNLGIGGAVQTGLLYAVKHGYEVTVRIDADGQHDPDDVARLLEPLFNGAADMVIGSRFLAQRRAGYRPGFLRHAGIRYLSMWINLLVKSKVTDPTSGFCAWNRRAIRKFSSKYPIDFPEPEAIVLASRCGLRIKEVAVTMRERYAGVTTINQWKSLYYLLKVTFALGLHMMKPKRGVPDER